MIIPGIDTWQAVKRILIILVIAIISQYGKTFIYLCIRRIRYRSMKIYGRIRLLEQEEGSPEQDNNPSQGAIRINYAAGREKKETNKVLLKARKKKKKR